MNDMLLAPEADLSQSASAPLRLLAGLVPPGAAGAGLGHGALGPAGALIWGRARPPFPADLWRIETEGADPQDHEGAARRAWQRAPWCLRVRLAHYPAGQKQPDIVSDAIIGTRRDLAALEAAILHTGLTLLRAALAGSPHAAAVAPVLGTPRAARFGAGLSGALRHAWQRQRERLLTEQWSIGVAARAIGAVLENGLPEPIDWVQPPPGTYLADPFPWPGTGQVLAELVPHATGIGHIVALGPDANRRLAPRQVVLQRKQHLSYPNTAVIDGQVLLLPEDTGAGATVLHWLRADGNIVPLSLVAPGRRLADPTLFAHEGRLWIAATDIEIGPHDNLVLFHAERAAGPWRPHRRDPVRIDIRNARPAGTPFRHEGALFRPAQDCAESYGAALTINLIERLDPEHFAERPVRRLRPDPRGPYPHGLHTLSADGGRVLIDGKRLVFRVRPLLAKAAHRLGGRRNG